jgi:HD-GYP domain-containing protein (c-di-GMP phosphodiesterase class II)
MTAPSRLADLLASMSLLSDLGFALPPEESMRSCLIATSLARRMGLAEGTVADVYYTALLQHAGCTGFAHETAIVYGDELAINAAAARTDTTDVADMVNTFLRAATRGKGPVAWTRATLYTLVRGSSFGRRYATARCEVGRETARRLGLGEGVRRGLHEVAEAWAGGDGALALAGEDIAPAGRLAALAATAARFDEIGGPEAAVEAVRRRAGRELDPSMAAAFVARAAEILAESRDGDPRDGILAAEPTPVRTVASSDLPAVAEAIGDLADLKTTFTLGHSGGVAALATAAAVRHELDVAAVERVRLAGLLHDIGRVGISNAIWEQPRRLTSAEWEQVRLHPYHSERMLARSDALRPVAAIAGMHHERQDGSGYHRGSPGREVPMEARILAASDAFQAMTQVRPHRAALSLDEAAAALRAEAAAGRLDPDAVASVVAAAGVEGIRGRPSRPSGLSDREVEVLRLVAAGLTNRQIADRLIVSPRTAEHHVQHIYAKIGASSRAAAALFAMEHGLLE